MVIEEALAMLASITSCGLSGIDGFTVTAEVNLANGMPMFEIVGLPDASVKEYRERVRAALHGDRGRKWIVALGVAGIALIFLSAVFFCSGKNSRRDCLHFSRSLRLMGRISFILCIAYPLQLRRLYFRL